MPRQFHHADALQTLNNTCRYIITSQNRYVCLVLEFGTLTGAHIGIMFACRLPKGALGGKQEQVKNIKDPNDYPRGGG
jgi:hypothetical protein